MKRRDVLKSAMRSQMFWQMLLFWSQIQQKHLQAQRLEEAANWSEVWTAAIMIPSGGVWRHKVEAGGSTQHMLDHTHTLETVKAKIGFILFFSSANLSFRLVKNMYKSWTLLKVQLPWLFLMTFPAVCNGF